MAKQKEKLSPDKVHDSQDPYKILKEKVAQNADKINSIFESNNLRMLRTFADAVRAMRLKSSDIVEQLPKGS